MTLKEGIMRRMDVPPRVVVLAVLLFVSGLVAAEMRTLVVPKGTTVEKIGEGHFKLLGPEGCVFEIKGFKKAAPGKAVPGAIGILGDCGIYDRNGKLIAVGTGGFLKSGAKAIIGDSGKTMKAVPASDYFKIDDEVTWLPATIEFQPGRIFNRPALQKMCLQPLSGEIK
jgi:hypothetical protein